MGSSKENWSLFLAGGGGGGARSRATEEKCVLKGFYRLEMCFIRVDCSCIVSLCQEPMGSSLCICLCLVNIVDMSECEYNGVGFCLPVVVFNTAIFIVLFC